MAAIAENSKQEKYSFEYIRENFKDLEDLDSRILAGFCLKLELKSTGTKNELIQRL